jgi:hypothetical protein
MRGAVIVNCSVVIKGAEALVSASAIVGSSALLLVRRATIAACAAACTLAAAACAVLVVHRASLLLGLLAMSLMFSTAGRTIFAARSAGLAATLMVAVLPGWLCCGMILVVGFMARAARTIFATVRAGNTATCARLVLIVLRRCLRITTYGVNKAGHTESQGKGENFDSIHLCVSRLKRRVMGFANERFIDALSCSPVSKSERRNSEGVYFLCQALSACTLEAGLIFVCPTRLAIRSLQQQAAHPSR